MMKRFLPIVLLLLSSFSTFAQTTKTETLISKYAFANERLYIPNKDTTWTPTRNGALTQRPQDGIIYQYFNVAVGPDWTPIIGAGGGDVSSVFGRIGAVTALEADYSAFYPLLSGTYNNPSWLNQLAWSKITGAPITLGGYGITDAVPSSRTITINGVGYDLSANRSWTVTVSVDSGTLAVKNAISSPVIGQRFLQTNEKAGWYSWNGRFWEQEKPYDMIFDFMFTVKAYASSPGITMDASGGGDWRNASSIFDQPTNSKFYTHQFAFYTAAATAKSGFRAGPSSSLSNFTRGVDSNFVLHTRVGANLLSNATDAYTIYAGANTADGASDGNGEYFKYTHSNNSGNWQCITKTSSGTTTINTSVPFVAGEAYDLVITYYGDDKVEFFINGVFVGQSTSNFTQRLYDAGAWIQRSAGTGIVYMAADRLKLYRW